MLLKNNSIAREFITNKMKEKDVEFNVDTHLNDEFFEGLIDMFKFECLGVVMFNHKFFQFVESTHSIPYND